MSIEVSTESPPKQTIEMKRKSAIKGAFWSEFVDMFDIYLPTVVLTPALAYFQPAQMPQGLAAIFTSLVLITTLLGRPLGAAFFGSFGDRIGRRKATITSISGFGITTLLIGLLPGYSLIGISAYWLLVALRFLDGFFLGGGYTGAIPLAMESAEKQKRGLVGGLIIAAFPFAYVVINLLAMATFAIAPLAGPESPYMVWGWRIPFFIGALLSGILVIYYVSKVSESETWEKAGTKVKMPLRELLRGKSGKSFLQVFIFMTGLWFTQNIVTLFVPTILLKNLLNLSKYQLTFTLLISYCLLCFSYIGAGILGQKIGRRKLFIISCLSSAIVGSILLAVLVNGKGLPLPLIILLVCIFSIIVTSPWGGFATYINERFHTDVRASGFGMGYSLAVIIPSFYAFYMNWLDAIMPYQLTAVAILCIGGLIGALGAAMGPETKDVDF